MCVQANPVSVQCHEEPVRIETSKEACQAMVRPMQEFWTAEAEANKANLLFLGVACKAGYVS